MDDIFDIGITFTHGQPIMRVFTDLIVMSEEQKQDNIPTPIHLSIIMEEEEETKVEPISMWILIMTLTWMTPYRLTLLYVLHVIDSVP